MWSVPPPKLRNGCVSFRVGLLLTNRSPAIARDVYLSAMILPPGGNSRIGCEFPDLQNWNANQAFGCITQVIAKDSFRLAPHVVVQPIRLLFSLIPPFPERFLLEITTGCHGSPLKKFSHRVSPADLQTLYDQFVAAQTDRARREFVRRVIGGPEERDEGGAYEEQ
jgi:hypothetical protein